MALPPMGPMSPPSPTLGGPQPNMGPPPMPPMPQMGGGMAPPMAPPPMGPQMGPPPINPTNPTAGNGQSFGGDAGGRKTFSQYLQSMNTSFPPTPTMPDPMAGGIGGGAPSMPPLAMMGGGAVPRSTMIGREPHRLAYINPGEEMMLRASGGTGEPGPGGVPAFRGGGGGFGGFEGPGGYGGYDGGFGEAGRGGKDSDAPGRGPGDFGGGPGDGDRGDIDPGFIDALAEAAVDNSYFDAFETDPDKLADQVAFESISSQVPDIIGPNAPVSNVDAQNAVALATEAFDPYKDVVDFNTASTLPSIESSPITANDIGVNTLDEAFLNQYNDPNLSVNIPGTNVNMPDVSSLLGGVVRPDMMPPGYQPTPDVTTADPTFDQFVSNKAAVGRPIDRIDPTLGQPGSINLNAQMPTVFKIHQVLALFNDTTGIDDSSFSTPIGVETGIQDPSGVQDPSFIAGMNQADANIAAPILGGASGTPPNVNEIANIQAADVYGLPNIGLDTSFSAAQFADTLNPQGPTFTPTTLGLDEAARGQALADRVSLENRESVLSDINTPVQGTTLSDDVIASNQAALDNLDLSTKGLGPDPFDNEFRKDLSYAQIDKLIDEKLSLQAEIDANKGKFNLLSLVPGANLLGTSAGRRQKAINQVLSNDGGSGILKTGIGGATGVLGTGATSFNPVYDKDGNFVGSQGVSKSGETVSYMGDMQGDKGYFDSDGDNVEMSKAIEGYQEDIGGQGSPEGLDEPYNPCQPGFELDPNTNTCVPIDVVGGGGGSSGPIDLNPIIRPTTPVVTPDPVPPKPVVSPVLRMPKQFNMGGATSGSNLDGAIGRLLSSMS